LKRKKHFYILKE